MDPSVKPSSEPTVKVEVVLAPVDGMESTCEAPSARLEVFESILNVAPDATTIEVELAMVPFKPKSKVAELIVVEPE